MNLFDIFKQKEQEPQEIEERFLSGGRNFSLSFNDDKNKNIYMEKIPHLKKGVDLISSLIASLPIQLQQENESIKVIANDNRLKLLNLEPNVITTASKFKAQLVNDLVLKGRAYALIERKGTKITGLHYVKCVNVDTYRNDKGIPVKQEIHYILGGKQYSADMNDFLIIHNPNGGILDNSRETLQKIIEEYEAYEQLLNNTARPRSVLQTEGKLSDNAIEKLRQAWNNLYSGRKNAGKTIILENGLQYKSIDNDISLVDTEKAEKVIGQKIEAILGLPVGMLTSEESNKHEVQEILLSNTINGLIVAIEQALSKCLLLETEKDKGYKLIIDTKEIKKSNDSQYNSNVIELFNNGIITLKQTREMLDLETNDIERDCKILSLGNVIQYVDDGEIFIPNTGVTVNGESKQQTITTKETTEINHNKLE